MEILGNIAKIGDLIVAEQNGSTGPIKNTEDEIKWAIDDESIQMMEEHIAALVHYNFMGKNDRWPYDNEDIKLFVAKYLKSHIVNDTNVE
jgi:hypothetical protein